MAARKPIIWGVWIVGASCLTVYLVFVLYSDDRGLFLIGQTTLGHHQIELACGACHTSPFGGTDALQKSCVQCHGAELAAVQDSHPRSKFTDPRNADRVAILDARFCVTCHREHRPGITLVMGLTLPGDYCFKCHQDIGKDRPSHRGLAFDSCASAGCHNFHDNKALYEDFLGAHLHEPEDKAKPLVPVRAWSPADPAWADRAKPALTRVALTGLPAGKTKETIIAGWEASQHAKAGVGCAQCHEAKPTADGTAATAAWADKPDHRVCSTCHKPEVAGFLASRHGMRLDPQLDVKLGPMSPALARIPMKADAHDKQLGCATCHDPHSVDTRAAAVAPCMGCHDDRHTRNYKKSPHYALWQAEIAGTAPAGSGVSCATCHLPREVHKAAKGDRVLVQHNQSLNLRPNEKMIRSVCMNCHGLGFTIDALADAALVQANFDGLPAKHIESLDWVARRQKTKRRSATN